MVPVTPGGTSFKGQLFGLKKVSANIQGLNSEAAGVAQHPRNGQFLDNPHSSGTTCGLFLVGS